MSGWVGGQMGPVMIATDARIKTGILLLGGICGCKRHPGSDPANFAPRVTIPMLMINTRDDSIFPMRPPRGPCSASGQPCSRQETHSLPRRHSIPREYRKQYCREIVEWLDRYFGPVQ
jgi:hypothetical protein